jgi:hypothetical protein
MRRPDSYSPSGQPGNGAGACDLDQSPGESVRITHETHPNGVGQESEKDTRDRVGAELVNVTEPQKVSRAEQRDQLLTALGMLADPIRRLLENAADETMAHASYVRAQFQVDYQQYLQLLVSFTRVGHLEFVQERQRAKTAVWKLESLLDYEFPIAALTTRTIIMGFFHETMRTAEGFIRAIPTDEADEILSAGSPFATYCRLRALVQGAATRIDVLDPYLDAAVFHRFFRDALQADVTIVTSQATMDDKRRRDRIVAVSELYGQERGQTHYRLLVTTRQHDRHMRIDDGIFHLGGSVKDASLRSPYTLASLDPTQSNHAFLDGIIAAADEWFGPSTTTHRRR